MTEIERMLIEHECARMVTLFHVRADRFEHDLMVDMFTDDGVFDHFMMGILEGRAAIQDYFDRKDTNQITCHTTTCIIIDVIDENNAKGQAYFTTWGSPPAATIPVPIKTPMCVGKYEDQFVRTADGWRFAHRKSTGLFMPAVLPAPLLREEA